MDSPHVVEVGTVARVVEFVEGLEPVVEVVLEVEQVVVSRLNSWPMEENSWAPETDSWVSGKDRWVTESVDWSIRDAKQASKYLHASL